MKKKTKTDQREHSLQVMLGDDEKAMIDRAAEALGLATAAFVRSKAIEAARTVLNQPAGA